MLREVVAGLVIGNVESLKVRTRVLSVNEHVEDCGSGREGCW